MITLVRCKLLELYQSLSTFMHAELAAKKFIILVPRGRGLDEKPIVASTTKLHSSSSQISKIPKPVSKPVLTRPDLKRAQIAKPVFVPKKKEVEKVKSSGVKTQREKEKAACSRHEPLDVLFIHQGELPHAFWYLWLINWCSIIRYM